MSSPVSTSVELSTYRDQHFKGSRIEQERLLHNTSTLYVGNLSFYTTEEQIYELFSKCGDIKRIIMGLDKYKKTPCGFCFVEYYQRCDAESCMRYVNGTRLDDRIVRTDWDAGFVEGRQYGRGKSGGQIRDGMKSSDLMTMSTDSRVVSGNAALGSNLKSIFGMVRDEYRKDYDSGRGGYGKNVQQESSITQAAAIFSGQ